MTDHTGHLTLVCGMVCAGKTTLARRLEMETNAVRFSPDEWILEMLDNPEDRPEADRLRVPVEALQWQLAQRLLSLGVDVILENGFWGQQERLGYLDGARRLGARVTLQLLDVPRRELLKRIDARNVAMPAGSFRIYPGELDTWLGWFDVPDERECLRYDEFHIHRTEETE